MARSDPEFNRLRAKVLEPDPRQLWEKASVEYAVFFERVRAFTHQVHTKKLFRLWRFAGGAEPVNWPRHLDWPITHCFRDLWGDPIPTIWTDSARSNREYQILILCFAHGLTVEDAKCVIEAWWEHHNISPDEMGYRVFLVTEFQGALTFTEPARNNFEGREREKREVAKAERRRNSPPKTGDRIREILEAGPATVDDITAQLGDVNRAAVKKQCQRMAVTGEIEKLAAGKYSIVRECEATVHAEVRPAPDPPVMLSEEDRQSLGALQIESDMDEWKFLELQKEDFFPELVERLKADYDYLFAVPQPVEAPDWTPPFEEFSKARLPF